MLINCEQYRVRNTIWELWTPNEIYHNLDQSRQHLGYDYCDIESIYAAKYHISSPKVWKEWRIVQAKTMLDVKEQHRWWNDPMFMDKVFWCYHKPIKISIDNQPVNFYALECLESARVAQACAERYGRPMFKSQYPGLLIPQECLDNCWNETTNGVADNIRERPEEVVTQAQIDRDSKIEELLDQVKPVDFEEMKTEMNNAIDRNMVKKVAEF